MRYPRFHPSITVELTIGGQRWLVNDISGNVEITLDAPLSRCLYALKGGEE
jgi:hypothetical protein